MIGIACRCGGIRTNGVCNRCGPRKDNRTQADRPHNSYRWLMFSRRFLALNPLCTDCDAEGRVTAATQTHHVIKVDDDPTRIFDADNCMALCATCHSVRTRRGE